MKKQVRFLIGHVLTQQARAFQLETILEETRRNSKDGCIGDHPSPSDFSYEFLGALEEVGIFLCIDSSQGALVGPSIPASDITMRESNKDDIVRNDIKIKKLVE